VRSLVTQLANDVAPIARSERNATLLFKFMHTALPLGVAHASLTHAGVSDADFDHLIRAALGSGHVHAVQRLPFRTLELRWLELLLFGNEVAGTLADPIADSVLRTAPHPIHMLDSEAYALTHEIMYVTDFGARRPPPWLMLPETTAMVDAALAWQIDTGNLDLIGELLMGHVFLGEPWSPYAACGFDLLHTRWGELDFMPGPGFEVATYRGLDKDEAAAYVFHKGYHTTFVWGLLCAALLGCPEHAVSQLTWTPNNQLEAKANVLRQCSGAIRLAMEFSQGRERSTSTGEVPSHGPQDDKRATMSLGGTAAPSQTLMESNHPRPVDETEQAMVRQDGLLIRAAREYDLSALTELLSDETQALIPVSYTYLQSVRFLLRQQLPCGAIGAYFASPVNLASPVACDITAAFTYALAVAAGRLLREVSSGPLTAHASEETEDTEEWYRQDSAPEPVVDGGIGADSTLSSSSINGSAP
jgi:hypothetical protein